MLASDMPLADVAKYWKRPEAELESLRDIIKEGFTITAVTSGERGEPTLIFDGRGRLTLDRSTVPQFVKAFGKDITKWVGREVAIIPQSY
jgi:hypothetical protein